MKKKLHNKYDLQRSFKIHLGFFLWFFKRKIVKSFYQNECVSENISIAR